ncbi:hypothetical protein [Streptomyces cucumeris]|uniref:hypothetical protein n=1 Tax=Streptomyces cucumeris TaxID=2962890 RepID=UPI003D70DDEF
MCPTCQDEVYLSDDRLGPDCVCAQCLARQARTAGYSLPEEFADDPQECTTPQCGWARAMGAAA